MDTYTVRNALVWLAPNTQSCDGSVRWAKRGCSFWGLSLHQTALLKCLQPHLWDYVCKSDQNNQNKERNIYQVARWPIPAVTIILTICWLYVRPKGPLKIVTQHSSSANPTLHQLSVGLARIQCLGWLLNSDSYTLQEVRDEWGQVKQRKSKTWYHVIVVLLFVLNIDV